MLSRLEQKAADIVMDDIEEKLEELYDGAEEKTKEMILQLKYLEYLEAELGSGHYPIPEISHSYGGLNFALKVTSPTTDPAFYYLRLLAKKGWRRKYKTPDTNELGISWWLEKEIDSENISLRFFLNILQDDEPASCKIVKVGEYTTPKYMMICPNGSEKLLGKGEETG